MLNNTVMLLIILFNNIAILNINQVKLYYALNVIYILYSRLNSLLMANHYHAKKFSKLFTSVIEYKWGEKITIH